LARSLSLHLAGVHDLVGRRQRTGDCHGILEIGRREGGRPSGRGQHPMPPERFDRESEQNPAVDSSGERNQDVPVSAERSKDVLLLRRELRAAMHEAPPHDRLVSKDVSSVVSRS
jgi:hypothetical protein